MAGAVTILLLTTGTFASRIAIRRHTHWPRPVQLLGVTAIKFLGRTVALSGSAAYSVLRIYCTTYYGGLRSSTYNTYLVVST